MPTKAELEQQVAQGQSENEQLRNQVVALTEELAHKQAAVEQLRDEAVILAQGIVECDATIAELEAKTPKEISDEIAAILARSCINCGNSGRISYDAEAGTISCAFCKHIWTIAEEQAPFRQK